MNSEAQRTKEERRKSWDYAIGMSKVDGGEPSQEFLDLAEKEINGDIPEGDTLKRTLEKWAKIGEPMTTHSCKPKSNDPDPYSDPKSGVMKNKLKLKDSKLLSQAETELTAARMDELHRNPIQSDFDSNHLYEIHRRIFQDIYEWAGEPRTRDIFKHEAVLNGASVDYAKAENISVDLQEAINNVTSKNYVSMSLDEQAKNVALDLRDVWEVHPFREGNTRTSLHFCCDFMESQGIPIDRTLFANNSKFTRDALTAASRTYESYSGRTQRGPLIKIVKDSLHRMERI